MILGLRFDDLAVLSTLVVKVVRVLASRAEPILAEQAVRLADISRADFSRAG